jgi:hypothetical protein
MPISEPHMYIPGARRWALTERLPCQLRARPLFRKQISTLSAFPLEDRGFPAGGESPVLSPQEVFHDRNQ